MVAYSRTCLQGSCRWERCRALTACPRPQRRKTWCFQQNGFILKDFDLFQKSCTDNFLGKGGFKMPFYDVFTWQIRKWQPTDFQKVGEKA